MKTKFWNGSFLRTVLQCLAIACAALLALSALGAGLVLGGVVDQKQIPAAACCICFAAVFLGSFLAAKHTAGKRLPAALAVAGCCFAVCFLARLTAFGNTQLSVLRRLFLRDFTSRMDARQPAIPAWKTKWAQHR